MRPLIALAILLTASIAHAKDEDFKSPDQVIKALYEVISGPSGQKRDWDRMRSLFTPEAKMIAIYKTKSGDTKRQVLTVEDYVRLSGPYLEKEGFFEKETKRTAEEFGGLMHVWSTYESRHKLDDKKPFERGINSLQLWNDGKRWWVISIAWQGEDSSTPLPKKYGG